MSGHGQDDPDLNNVWWDDKGVHPNNIIPVVADPIGGSQGWYDTVVKVTKAGPNDKYGDIEGNWEKHVAGLQGNHALRLHRRPAPQDASGNGLLGRAGERQAQGAAADIDEQFLVARSFRPAGVIPGGPVFSGAVMLDTHLPLIEAAGPAAAHLEIGDRRIDARSAWREPASIGCWPASLSRSRAADFIAALRDGSAYLAQLAEAGLRFGIDFLSPG